MLANAKLVEFQDGEHLFKAKLGHARRGLGLAAELLAGGALNDPFAASWVPEEPVLRASLVPHVGRLGLRASGTSDF